MPELQLIALGILIVCASLLILSFLPGLKSKMKKNRSPMTKPVKLQKPKSITENQQVILDAINIVHVKMTRLTQKVDKLIKDVAKL